MDKKKSDKSKSTATPSPLKLALEPRIVFDAAGVDTMVDTLDFYDTNQSEDFEAQTDLTLNKLIEGKAVVVIDKNVHDFQKIIDQVGDKAEIIQIETSENGIEAITRALENYDHEISELHIISNGQDGEITLGNTFLSSGNLDSQSSSIQEWETSLTNNADIMLYGSNIAESDTGKAFVDSLSQLTNSDVHASNDPTIFGGEDVTESSGHFLEYDHGQIDPSEVYETVIKTDYGFTLDTQSNEAFVETQSITLEQAIYLDSHGDLNLQTTENNSLVVPYAGDVDGSFIAVEDVTNESSDELQGNELYSIEYNNFIESPSETNLTNDSVNVTLDNALADMENSESHDAPAVQSDEVNDIKNKDVDLTAQSLDNSSFIIEAIKTFWVNLDGSSEQQNNYDYQVTSHEHVLEGTDTDNSTSENISENADMTTSENTDDTQTDGYQNNYTSFDLETKNTSDNYVGGYKDFTDTFNYHLDLYDQSQSNSSDTTEQNSLDESGQATFESQETNSDTSNAVSVDEVSLYTDNTSWYGFTNDTDVNLSITNDDGSSYEHVYDYSADLDFDPELHVYTDAAISDFSAEESISYPGGQVDFEIDFAESSTNYLTQDVSTYEDHDIRLNVDVDFVDQGDAETHEIKITVPEGIMLSDGEHIGDHIWIVNEAQLQDIKVITPENYSGSFDIQIDVTNTDIADNDITSVSETINIHLHNVADIPVLNVPDILQIETDTEAYLPISAEFYDNGGSENHTIAINAPETVTFSDGIRDSAGVWHLQPDDLSELTFTYDGEAEQFEIEVSTNVFEENGDRHSIQETIIVDKKDLPQPLVQNEDSLITMQTSLVSLQDVPGEGQSENISDIVGSSFEAPEGFADIDNAITADQTVEQYEEANDLNHEQVNLNTDQVIDSNDFITDQVDHVETDLQDVVTEFKSDHVGAEENVIEANKIQDSEMRLAEQSVKINTAFTEGLEQSIDYISFDANALAESSNFETHQHDNIQETTTGEITFNPIEFDEAAYEVSQENLSFGLSESQSNFSLDLTVTSEASENTLSLDQTVSTSGQVDVSEPETQDETPYQPRFISDKASPVDLFDGNQEFTDTHAAAVKVDSKTKDERKSKQDVKKILELLDD